VVLAVAAQVAHLVAPEMVLLELQIEVAVVAVQVVTTMEVGLVLVEQVVLEL
jgi:hypothetical protein